MSHSIQFVAAEAVGWIPYYERLADMPTNDYYVFATESKRKWIACDMLFYSGNTPTPAAQFLEQQREFAELLHSKNYRGALWLRDIRLHCYDNDTYKVECKPLVGKQHVGYTPMRMPQWRGKTVLAFSKGQGSEIEPSVVKRPDGANLSYEVRFRIGRIGNLATRLLTKNWAPDAWLRVDYELRRDGNCTIAYSGSRIPSSVHYQANTETGRQRVYYHNMETNDLATIRSIITPPRIGRMDENYYHSVRADGWRTN
jgi:hypothetical protein